MIAIFDNGCGYSDHAIWFVDIGDEDPKLIEKVAQAGRDCSRPFLVLTAPMVEWYSGALMPLQDLIGGFWCDDEDDLRGLDSETMRAILRLAKPGSTNEKLFNAVLAKWGA